MLRNPIAGIVDCSRRGTCPCNKRDDITVQQRNEQCFCAAGVLSRMSLKVKSAHPENAVLKLAPPQLADYVGAGGRGLRSNDIAAKPEISR